MTNAADGIEALVFSRDEETGLIQFEASVSAFG